MKSVEELGVESNNSKNKDKEIKFLTKAPIYWDDWGQMRLVFRQGVVYKGVLHPNGNVTAESPAYGVSDSVDTTKIEILQ